MPSQPKVERERIKCDFAFIFPLRGPFDDPAAPSQYPIFSIQTEKIDMPRRYTTFDNLIAIELETIAGGVIRIRECMVLRLLAFFFSKIDKLSRVVVVERVIN